MRSFYAREAFELIDVDGMHPVTMAGMNYMPQHKRGRINYGVSASSATQALACNQEGCGGFAKRRKAKPVLENLRRDTQRVEYLST